MKVVFLGDIYNFGEIRLGTPDRADLVYHRDQRECVKAVGLTLYATREEPLLCPLYLYWRTDLLGLDGAIRGREQWAESLQRTGNGIVPDPLVYGLWEDCVAEEDIEDSDVKRYHELVEVERCKEMLRRDWWWGKCSTEQYLKDRDRLETYEQIVLAC